MKKNRNGFIDIPFFWANKNHLSIKKLHTLFIKYCEPTYYFDGEHHIAWEFIYVFEGELTVTTDSMIYTLSKGSGIFLAPFTHHKLRPSTPTSAILFICSFELEGKISKKLRNSIFHLTNEQNIILDSLINTLYSYAGLDGKNNDFLRTYLLNSYEIHFLDYFLKQNNDDTIIQLTIKYLETLFMSIGSLNLEKKETPYDKKILLYIKIAETLEKNVYSKITIPQIADICNTSASTIKSCFFDYTGYTIHKYFLNLKIRTAIKLLQEGNTVGEVSDMLQFSSQNYFSCVFKRETGVSPSTYRNK